MLVAQVIGWILVLAVVASLASRRLSVASHPVIIVATFAPYFALPALVAAILLAYSGSLIGALVALALAFAVVVVQAWPFVSDRRSSDSATTLTVMTSNILTGKGDADRIMEIAIRQGADVVALQELTEESVSALRAAGIDTEYPFSLVASAPMWNGVGLWSRYPLRAPRTDVHGELYRAEAVVGIHPEDPDSDPCVISLHIHAPWPNDPGPWLEQLAGLKADLHSRARPVIAMGDYNATLDHRPFRALLTGDCTDAGVTSRAWWALTYPGFRFVPPLITIDHVVSRGARATHVRSFRIAESDHLAVVARLALTGRAQPR